MGKHRHSQGVLSDIDIINERDKCNIIIEPFSHANLSNCSYDITLGKYYYRNTSPIPYFNPWNVENVHSYWGEPIEASKATEENYHLFSLKVGDEYILLHPGESILGHTNEFIGGQKNITTMMKARSSLGRSNVTVCRDAGWGDIGYINRWTMEITNNSSSPIILPVGARVGQIVFIYTSTPSRSYHGKYQEVSDLETLRKLWSPSSMLPKLSREITKLEKKEDISEEDKKRIEMLFNPRNASIIALAEKADPIYIMEPK